MLLIEQMEIEVSTQTVIFDDGKNHQIFGILEAI